MMGKRLRGHFHFSMHFLNDLLVYSYILYFNRTSLCWFWLFIYHLFGFLNFHRFFKLRRRLLQRSILVNNIFFNLFKLALLYKIKWRFFIHLHLLLFFNYLFLFWLNWLFKFRFSYFISLTLMFLFVFLLLLLLIFRPWPLLLLFLLRFRLHIWRPIRHLSITHLCYLFQRASWYLLRHFTPVWLLLHRLHLLRRGRHGYSKLLRQVNRLWRGYFREFDLRNVHLNQFLYLSLS